MTHAKSRPAVSVPTTAQRGPARGRDWPRRPRRDPHARLITQLLALAGPDSSVIATSTRPWASATFVGQKHRVVLRFDGTDHAARADGFAARLPEAEFALSGHIVADACVDRRVDAASGTTTGPADDDAPTALVAPLAPAASQDGGTILALSLLTIEEW